jgi:hypothetical protein
MNAEEILTEHPAARAVITGAAPRPARMAAAKGMLPLPQADLLEVLVCLANEAEDAELSASARETFAAQDSETLLTAISESEIAPNVLAFVAESEGFNPKIYESVLSNAKTPDQSVIRFAQKTADGSLLELLTVNQQRLIRNPALLDAILTNAARTTEAERRAKETRQEFFEKSRGAQQIVDELRARGDEAAAEFLEQAEFAANLSETESDRELTIEDAVLLAAHIEVPDAEIDDSWLGFEFIEEIYEETEEQRRALAEKIISESSLDGEIAPDRIQLIKRVMMMGIKDRVKLAIKGDREARTILIRDPNKVVAQAVLANPRITEQEVEKISAMRTVPDEVLRSIGTNRTWARNYPILHNLVRNPRCPLPTAMTILTRIQAKDLQGIANNRNVSEAVRKQAFRLLATRRG